MSGKRKPGEGIIAFLNRAGKEINLKPLKIKHSRLAGCSSADTHFSNTSQEVHESLKNFLGKDYACKILSVKRKIMEESVK
jgi:hypothetical protein